ALAVLGGGAYLLVGGGDGSGAGTFTGTVGGDAVAGTHAVHVPAGSVAIVTVTPSADFDAVVGFAVDDEVGVEIDVLYASTPFAPQAADQDVADAFALGSGETIDAPGPRAVFRVDVGFPGEGELTFLAAPFDVDATVVVTGFVDEGERSGGDYEITIEIEALEFDDDTPSGDDLLDAIAADEGVPDSLTELIRTTDELD
nr:hypothetical protein [Acidimicrobiia bacterium]